MKTTKLRFFLLLTVVILTVFALAACVDTGNTPDDPPVTPPGPTTVVYVLELRASATEAARGENITLTAVLTSAGQEESVSEEAEFIIVEGAEYASIEGNVLTVNNSANNGNVIKVKAREGATDSAVVSITVKVPPTSLTIAAGGATNLSAGQSIVLTHTAQPTGADQNITYVITEGEESAVISGNVLVVNVNAATGATIKVKASIGELESNELTFTVGYPLEALLAESALTNITTGNSTQLSVSLTPAGATNGSYEWEFIEGADYAVIIGNVLTVKDGAPTGATIRIKAVAGDIESNELVFTVGYPLKSLTATLSGSANIKNGSSAQLIVSKNPTNATNGDYIWDFVAGADYATIIGNVITVKDDAPIGSVIKIAAVAGNIKSNEIVIIVGTPIQTVTISSTAPEILDRGASYPISAQVAPTGASINALDWVVEDGKDYVTLSSGTMFVNKNTPAGTKVTVYATSGSITSNKLTFTVGVVLESISIQLSGSSNIDPDGSRVILHTLNPSNASDTDITWVIDDGADYATVTNSVITVKSDAPIGATVTFHAEIGSIKSEEISITVGTPIENISIEAIGSTEIVKGNTVGLLATLTPSNASASLVEWVITEGEEFASLIGTTLMIKSDADTGATIKVKAVFNDIESNELEFTVMATQEEINAQKYMLDLSTNNIRIDKKGSFSPILSAEIINGNYEQVTDLKVDFEVISGNSFLGINENGYTCSFNALGHGIAEVKVSINGTDIYEIVSVEVIVPPDAITLPGTFAERPLFEYSFSMVDPFTNSTESLPFVPTVKGDSLACRDLAFKFVGENGAEGDEVAVYENGSITFKQTGKVTVTVSSVSGSLVEATASYTFNINKGYNVSTFEELSYVIEDSSYKGNLPINIVVLEKPVAPEGSTYEYSYDLVPLIALKPQSEITSLATILRNYLTVTDTNGSTRSTNVRIQAVNKGLWLNGNNHRIDVSQLKIFTMAEYEAYAQEYGISTDEYITNVSSILSAETWYQNGPTDPDFVKQSYSVKLYNLEVKGNTQIDYDPSKYNYEGETKFVGACADGISIGSYIYDTHYYIDANNITAHGVYNGLKFNNIVGNGKVSNLNAYNCYSTGIVVRSSIVTLENITIGMCGATGIELTPEDSGAAGINGDEKSKITISGTVNASANLNDGNTNYFNNYTIQGATVPQIIDGNIGKYNEKQVAHIRNENGQFIFVSLLFNDMKTFADNESIVEYPAYQEGGIISISELPTDGTVDTEHQFIRMDIEATIPGIGTVTAGTAYFYNHNYGK